MFLYSMGEEYESVVFGDDVHTLPVVHHRTESWFKRVWNWFFR